MTRRSLGGPLAALVVCAHAACSQAPAPTETAPPVAPAPGPTLAHPDERHLADIVQLTNGGENAEAYWAFAGNELIFQTTREPYACDQIMRMPADGSGPAALVSTGKGRTTCAYFLPGDKEIVYASTHHRSEACPTPPDMSQGYVWGLFDFDIFKANADGSGLVNLTNRPGYDAEATVCPVDGSILFTSTRNGDLDLYRMDADGSNVVQLTDTPGYDGGAFFNQDCSRIVWRASRPTGEALAGYQRLLAENRVRPGRLEIFVANADGSDAQQVTYLGAASFAPYFHPSGRSILFSTNHPDPRGREFDIWSIGVDGTGLERITHSPGFDGFPMFSPDGTRLAFSSNRNQAKDGETNVFVARWVEAPAAAAADTAAMRIKRDVAWLADDARDGRGVGTPGLEAAGRWLGEQMAAAGVAGAMADGGFAQAFDVTTGVDGSAVVSVDGKPVDKLRALGFSRPGKLVGKRTVFAGYGVVAPEHGVDDYRGRKVKGKVVVVRRFTASGAPFDDDALQRTYSDLRHKAFTARQKGAIGMIVVDLPEVKKGEEMPAEADFPALSPSSGDVGIPVVVVGRDAGASLVRGSHKVNIEVALQAKTQQAFNVVGVIRAGAADKLPGAVVVGAHYDHLGLGGAGSLEPDVRAPHNGADDNASGTAVLLEVARALAPATKTLRRDVYLVGFSGEESGLVGSTYFTKNPPPGLAVSDVVAMVNMDMVGRLRNNTLSVLGGDSGAEWSELVGAACSAAAVECSIGGSGYGPSDQTPFYAAGVPVLHMFTGAHGDYHKTTDDSDAINAAGAARVATIVAEVTRAVSAREQRISYQKVPAPAPAGDARSFGASLGTIPDYAGSEKQKGVLLAGVRPGGPADKGGLRRGDLLVKIGDTDILSVHDLMYVLRSAKPGMKRSVVVVRGGNRLELAVTFGTSARMRGGH